MINPRFVLHSSVFDLFGSFSFIANVMILMQPFSVRHQPKRLCELEKTSRCERKAGNEERCGGRLQIIPGIIRETRKTATIERKIKHFLFIVFVKRIFIKPL